MIPRLQELAPRCSSVDDQLVTATLQQLVRINSVNPDLSPDGRGEAEIAGYLARLLRDIGLEVAVHEPRPGRPSVVGILRGTGGGRSLMLNAHVDTVGVAGMRDAFSAEIRDGKLYGRGAYDMKGSVAACIGAVKALTGLKRLPGDVLLAFVADEEYASLGSTDLVRRYQPTGAIVTEPSALQVCVAHKGFIWVEVETLGRACHGSQYHLGVDANMRMGRFLYELESLEQELRRRTSHPYVGTPSLHAATLHGGTELSMYSASSRLQIERRTVPGESAKQVLSEIETIIDRLCARDDSFKATARILLTRDAFEVRSDADVVQSLRAAATAVLGREPNLIGENPWMDSALFAAAGIDTVVFGPTGAGAHSEEEWVDIASVILLGQVLANTALHYCAVPRASPPAAHSGED
jgi:acetylornithine deacetylase